MIACGKSQCIREAKFVVSGVMEISSDGDDIRRRFFQSLRQMDLHILAAPVIGEPTSRRRDKERLLERSPVDVFVKLEDDLLTLELQAIA